MKSRVSLNNSYTGYISKPNRTLVFFVLSIVFVLCYIYKCPAALDLGRYYEDAASWPPNTSYLDIIKKYYYSEFNFIYQTSLVFFNRTFLGGPFLTGLVVSTYYWYLIKNYYNNRYVGRNVYYMLGLLGFPAFIYVLTVSRTACAVVIFYFGVESYLNNKRKKAVLFFIAAIFTHVISGMFIGVFFVGIVINHLYKKEKSQMFNVLCAVLPPLAWIISSVILPSLMSSDILYSAFSDYNRFEAYLGDNYTSFSMDSYALADRAMMSSYILAGYVLLNLTKYYSLKKCLFLTFFTALCFVGGSNFILLERYMIASSLFYAMLFTETLTLSGTGQCPLGSTRFRIIDIICIISALSLLLSLGLARRDFFSFL